MGGQLHESLTVVERTPWLRHTSASLLVVIAALLVWTNWNGAGASTSVLYQRIFLLGTALVWAVVAATLALVPWWAEARAWLIAAHLLIMGLYLGLAIGTTNWNALSMRGWLQLWWTPPLLLGQIPQVLKLMRQTDRQHSKRLHFGLVAKSLSSRP